LGGFKINNPNAGEVDVPACCQLPSSITSSTVMTPAAEEVSTASAVEEGSGTSDAGDGSDTSTTGKRSTVATTGTGSDIGAITISQPRNDGRGTESSSKTTSISPPLGSASAGGSKAA
jgi:hypothetical protein